MMVARVWGLLRRVFVCKRERDCLAWALLLVFVGCHGNGDFCRVICPIVGADIERTMPDKFINIQTNTSRDAITLTESICLSDLLFCCFYSFNVFAALTRRSPTCCHT